MKSIDIASMWWSTIYQVHCWIYIFHCIGVPSSHLIFCFILKTLNMHEGRCWRSKLKEIWVGSETWFCLHFCFVALVSCFNLLPKTQLKKLCAKHIHGYYILVSECFVKQKDSKTTVILLSQKLSKCLHSFPFSWLFSLFGYLDFPFNSSSSSFNILSRFLFLLASQFSKG